MVTVPGLYQFFRRQLAHGFREQGIAEPATVDYLSDMLTRFAQTSALYMVRTREDAPAMTLAQLVTEWHRAQGWDDSSPSRVREAAIARHIGDYALFMSGFFRERVGSRGELAYYCVHGRGAFGWCARREHNPHRARVYHGLHGNFERFAEALDTFRRRQLPISPEARCGTIAALWRV
jgi:hypothetical protein